RTTTSLARSTPTTVAAASTSRTRTGTTWRPSPGRTAAAPDARGPARAGRRAGRGHLPGEPWFRRAGAARRTRHGPHQPARGNPRGGRGSHGAVRGGVRRRVVDRVRRAAPTAVAGAAPGRAAAAGTAVRAARRAARRGASGWRGAASGGPGPARGG